MNSILPGFIETWDMDDDTRNTIPMKRAGTVKEIGETAVFLASDVQRIHHRAKYSRRRRHHPHHLSTSPHHAWPQHLPWERARTS